MAEEFAELTKEQKAINAELKKQSEMHLHQSNLIRDYAASFEGKKKWDKKSAEQKKDAQAKMQLAYEDSGAATVYEFKQMQALEKEAAKEAKKRASSEKREAFALRKELIQNGITDEDFLSKAESDRREGLAITADQYADEHLIWKEANKKDKRDQAEKRKKDKIEEARLAANIRAEQS